MASLSSQSGCVVSELEERTLLFDGRPENICRLCRESDDQNMGQISPLAVEIQFVTNLIVADGDGLSTLICYRCIYELKQASTFIRRSVANDVAQRSEHAMRQAQRECSDDEQSTPPFATVMCEDLLNLDNKMAILKEELEENVIGEVDEMSNLVDGSSDNQAATVAVSQTTYESQETVESGAEEPVRSNWYSIPFQNRVARFSDGHKLSQATTSNSNESLYNKDRQICQKNVSNAFPDKLITHESDLWEDKSAKYFNSTKDSAHHASLEHSFTDICVCLKCGKKLDSLYMLNMHEKCHAQTDRFKCGTCEREFIDAVIFKCHMQTHTARNVYKCCDEHFVNPASLHLHISNHITVVLLERVETVVEFRNESDKVQTSTEFSNVSRPQRTKNKTTLFCQTHAKCCRLKATMLGPDKTCNTSQRENNRIFQCKKCNERFDLKVKLNRHIKSCRQAEGKKVRTKQAQGAQRSIRAKSAKVKSTASISTVNIRKGIKLVNHKTNAVRVNAPKKCPICSKWVQYMGAHLKTHNVENRVHCKMCDKSFSRNDSLRRHVEKHLGLAPKMRAGTYKCLECLKVFSFKRSLKQHSSKFHHLE